LKKKIKNLEKAREREIKKKCIEIYLHRFKYTKKIKTIEREELKKKSDEKLL
jgi:hypothetical protein